MFKSICFVLVLTMMSSCSMIETFAVKTTGRIAYQGSQELLTEANWHNFNVSTPANLKFVESLWYTDQDNKVLLTTLIKGYGAYGFAGSETEGLSDLILEKDNSFYKEQAVLNYEKAIFYGLKYLEISGISREDFFARDFSSKVKTSFDQKFNADDYVAIFYLAQSFGGSINLQRTNVVKMGYFKQVKEMLTWVCLKDPSIENGSCSLFAAVIEASTPTMLGGSQSRARQMFLELIKKEPYNLLARLSFIQYHIIPSLEEEEFYKEMSILKADLDTWYKEQRGEGKEDALIYRKNRNFNLFNSVAMERYKALNKIKNEIF